MFSNSVRKLFFTVYQIICFSWPFDMIFESFKVIFEIKKIIFKLDNFLKIFFFLRELI